MFFIAGASQNGAGLFAFVTSFSYETPFYQIFEFSSDMISWKEVESSAYYI